MAATSIAGGFLVFLFEKNWLEAIIKKQSTSNRNYHTQLEVLYVSFYHTFHRNGCSQRKFFTLLL
ncbi:hypothetical protein E4T83_10305 [Streptococcus sp. AN2]|nr:hypothetical protein E4T83_10305 [Streptococcus sp. AN2]